ncbi:hypothetical protein [Helicobacter macacae]|nr:hypothetical protein [Helicobacter macacae]
MQYTHPLNPPPQREGEQKSGNSAREGEIICLPSLAMEGEWILRA